MTNYPQQRFIYKINSSRLKRAKWNLNITIEEAMDKGEIISLAESQLIRFIDDINKINTNQKYEDVKNIRKEINRIKKLSTTIDNRRKIKSLYNEIYNLLLIEDYICVIIDNMKDFNRMNLKKGFYINGMKFKHLFGTPGGVKKYTITYVNENIYDRLEEKINNARNMSKEFVPAKLEAYKSLVTSVSIPVSNPNGILVVNDCVTNFTDNVIKIDDTISKYPIVTYEKDYPIELVDSDGYALISPNLSRNWFKEIENIKEEDEEGKEYFIPSGYCLRNSFCKGMVFTFDFHFFSEKIAEKQYIVKDVWNKDRDIRNIELILTTSMLKLWDSYDSIEHYLECCEDNGYSFSITKHTPEKLENERYLNYQFNQSLYLDDDGIEKLIKPTIQEIREILDEDYRKSILFLKGIHLDKLNFNREENDFVKALMIDNRMINDPFVKNKIHNMIKKKITEAKIGVLKTTANFSIVSGDPFSLCQSIFNLEATGLLGKGEFYNKYWIDLNVDKVACFRAPMTCHNNIRILNLKNTKDMQFWYKYMNTVTIFNSWDTTAHALNGLDKDSDCIFLTNNTTIVNSIKNTDTIFCVQKSANKVIPTKEHFIKSNKDGFGDAIGVTTNHITSMFDVLANFDINSLEYKTLLERIMCGQNYQQNAIDKIKGIVSKPIPKEWYDYHFAITDFDKSILANKKPYFFNYIYPHRKKVYDKYIKQTESTCLMRFGITIDELIKLEEKTDEQIEYLKWYYIKMPVSISKSVMNCICWKVEKQFDNYNINKKSLEFDYSILMTDNKYSKGRYNSINKLYQDYIEKTQQYAQYIKSKRIDKEENKIHRQIFKDDFKKKAYELCSNAEELCNIVISICYKNTNSKQFAWDICGDIIINNLLKNNNYKVSYPIADINGDIEFCGNKFSMTTEVIDEINIE